MSEHISINRISSLREKMNEAGIDFIIINTADPHLSEYLGEVDKTREYFSGFTGSAGTLVISNEEAYLWTDSRYYIQAEKELEGSNIILMRDGEKNVPSVKTFLVEHVWDGQTVGVEFKSISEKSYRLYVDALGQNVSIVDISSIIRKCWEDRPKRVFNEIRQIEDDIAGKSVRDKLLEVRQNIDLSYVGEYESYTYIISDLCSIMWLLNLRGSDIKCVPVAYSYLCIDRNIATLFCSKKIINKDIVEALNENGVAVKEYGTFYQELDNIASDDVIIDIENNNANIIKSLPEYINVIDCDDFNIIKKHIKNDAEIIGMRSAHIKDAVVMIDFIKQIKELVQAGKQISEYEAGVMLNNMRKGIDECLDISFDTICAYGENAAIVHYSANENDSLELKAKGMLLVDSGGHYDFGTTDITRTIVLGEVSSEEKKCYTAVLKANLNLYDACFKDGIRGENLDILARMPIWNAGYDFGHGTGHGIGCLLSVHEGPVRISYRAKDSAMLKPGMVVSDEPGIYLENKFGIRLENALVVQEKSEDLYCFESLTLVPFDKDAIEVCDLTRREIEVLNEYHKKVYEKIAPLLDDSLREWLKIACSEI